MKRSYIRRMKLEQQMKKEIACILHFKIKDQILDIFTVSRVKLSNDYSNAIVFISFLKSTNFNELNKYLKILQKSSYIITKLLNKYMYLRILPKLKFIYDENIIYSMKLNKLINNLSKVS